jgi:hypothetical protein
VPPEPTTTNSHASKNSATSDKEVTPEAVPTKAQKKRARKKRKANTDIIAGDRQLSCTAQLELERKPSGFECVPAPTGLECTLAPAGLELDRPVSPQHVPKRARQSQDAHGVQGSNSGPASAHGRAQHVAFAATQADARRESNGSDDGCPRELLKEIVKRLDDEQDDLPPEEEHDDDCDCGFCGPCGAWAFARGEHPAQRPGGPFHRGVGD